MKNAVKPERNASENPYLNARQEYNDRYYELTKLANNWRVMALGSIAAAVILAGGMVAVSLQHKIVPFAVEFNEHAEPVRVTRADAMPRPTENQIRAALRLWVIGARTVYIDRRAQQDRIDATYAMTVPDSPAFEMLSSYHRDNNPYERSEKVTVEVVVNAVMAVSDETWQVEWTETTKQLSGRVLGTKVMQGSFTVIVVPPTTESQVMVNPTGVLVRQYSWTERI